MQETTTETQVSYLTLLKTKGFVPYLVAELLSAFSDNFYKFFLMFMISSQFDRVTSAEYISIIGVIFVMPYLLFLGYAGYLSDRFSKRSVFIYVKLAEIFITVLVLLAILSGSLTFMLVCLFLMMTRTCIFYPAKVGLVPEMLSKSYLSLANSLLWMTIFVAAILGALLGGVLFQLYENAQWVIGLVLIGIAIIGYVNSIRIPSIAFTPIDKPFPVNPWRDIIESAKSLRRRKSIAIAIFGIGWFWFLGTLFQTILPLYGKEVLMVDETSTALLQSFIGLGIASGCVFAGWVSKDGYEPGLIPFGSIGIAAGTLWAAFSGASYVQTSLALALTGFSAGVFIIPIYTFLHHRARGNERGRIFATANLVDTFGMLLSSAVYWVFAASVFRIPEDKILAIFGVVTVIITLYALKKMPIFFFRVINFLITRVAYRINVSGLDNVPDKGSFILVPNHVSYIDGLLLWAACRKRNISFMIYHGIYNLALFKWLFKILEYIPVYPGKRVKESLAEAKNHLEKGGALCIFPEGELTRTGGLLQFRRGVEKIIESIQTKNTPIIPVYIDQVWGSIFSYERGKFFFKVPHEVPSKISVAFGKPLPSDTKAFEIRQAVSDLGYQSVQSRKSKTSILPLEVLKTAKKRWFSPMLTSPNTKPTRFGRLVNSAINLGKTLNGQLDSTQKLIAVIGDPSLYLSVVNLALTFANKQVLNLPSTLTEAEIADVCKQHGIQTLISENKQVVKGVNTHIISASSLLVSNTKHIAMTVAMFATTSNFYIRKVLNNKAMPDDVIALIPEDESLKKFVKLTHYGIISNADAFSQVLFVKHKDWMLSEASYASAVGYVGQFWYPLLYAAGVACTNVPEKELSVVALNALMQQYQVSLLVSSGEFYKRILKAGKPLNFPNIRFAVAIGSAQDDSIYDEFEQQIKLELFEGLGVPQLPLVVSINHHSYISDTVQQIGSKKGSFGKVLPGVLAYVINPETQQRASAGEEGVLMLKGTNVVADADSESDGWINTNRTAFIDEDGFLHLTS